MIGKLEKINIIIITVGLVILSCLIIYTGTNNLFTENYSSLGDPYYTNQLLAFKRAPLLIWTTLITLIFVALEFIILIAKRLWNKL